jgi:hypothetical protein
MVQNYSTSCTQFDSAGACSQYNPFYATGLYVDTKSLSYWNETNKMNSAYYDAPLLQKFRCDYYVQQNPESNLTCDEIVAVASNQVFPGDVNVGTGTQKLLHYTFVF